MLHSFALHAGTGRLALLRTDADDRTWIELRTLAGDPLGEIPAKYLPLGPRWSPDGTSLAFFSNDGILYLHRLGAAPQPVFANPTLQAGFCQWSPDGKQLVFSAHAHVNGTPPNIYTLHLDSGQATQLTHDTRTVDRFPQPSPNGQYVAFQRQFLDEPELPPHVYIVDVQSGRCFPALDDPSRVARKCWSSDSSSLLVTVDNPGRRQVKVVRLADGAVTCSYASETLQSAVFSPRGDRILCVCADALLWFTYPDGALLNRLSLAPFSEVRPSLTGPRLEFDAQAASVYFLGQNGSLYRWNYGSECELVLEQSQPPARPVYTHEEYTIPSLDGRPIPVQRFIPPQPRAPAILFVHGGPGEPIDPNDAFMLRLLGEGVEFICAAYRGSSGYGHEHQEANRGEYGRADVWDVLAAGRDWKERTGGDRPLILAGYSYGGFLSLLGLARADAPWAAGIVMWTVSGLHRMDLHQQRALPSEPEQQALAQVERAPLEQAGRIRVPLLLFHGALDTSATVAEVQSIQKGILGAGGACELVLYPDDTHGLKRHRGEIHAAVLEFLKRFE